MKTLNKILCLSVFSIVYSNNDEYRDTIITFDGQIHVGKFIDYDKKWTYYNLNQKKFKKRKIKTSKIEILKLYDETQLTTHPRHKSSVLIKEIINPCKDSILLKDKNTMTDREFEYFKIKTTECYNYTQNLDLINRQKEINTIH